MPRTSASYAAAQEFQAPRELEHPLLPIDEVETDTLVWIQPQLMRPAYELWGGEQVVATLRYKSLLRPEALAAAADGLWLFDQTGVAPPRVRIRQGERIVGTYVQTEDDGGRLMLQSGQTYRWLQLGMWNRTWCFANEAGTPLLYFGSEAGLTARVRIVHADAVRPMPHRSLLALLGKYLMLSRRTAA